jgi:hypothetical protein
MKRFIFACNGKEWINWFNCKSVRLLMKRYGEMLKLVDRLRFSIANVKGYFSKNLGAPFILVFDVLIFVVAFIVIYRNPLVSYAAAIAYCFLVIGVVLQAFSYLKNKPCEEDAFGRQC